MDYHQKMMDGFRNNLTASLSKNQKTNDFVASIHEGLYSFR
jgi:hypothetical protein